ncbi:hypothetical protein EVAR_51844_1 [Eumeta japonica]|uniref:Uncharacterized protein n=1 Tax=Eumeta variegata TaxID=151549 RepID=A0A4C1YRK5_EUMVA|nr:hypothetical protein EVAR_51844_1 [Eumeta japonica]
MLHRSTQLLKLIDIYAKLQAICTFVKFRYMRLPIEKNYPLFFNWSPKSTKPNNNPDVIAHSSGPVIHQTRPRTASCVPVIIHALLCASGARVANAAETGGEATLSFFTH